MIRFFAAHPTAANLMMVIALITGLLTLPGLQRASFPDLPPREVEVTIIYPGASTEEVEEAICRRIEDATESISETVETRCEARENRARAILKMAEGANFDRFYNDVKSEVEAIDDFPEQIEVPIIQQIGLDLPVTSIAVYGPAERRDLKVYAEQVKDALQKLPEVSQVAIKGFSDRQIRIEVSAATLRQFNLSMEAIAARIARQSVQLPSGTIETNQQDILLRFDDERRNVREFADLIVVSSDTGAEIRLGDIATIKDRFEREEIQIEFDGHPAAILNVSRTRADDTLRVIDAVSAFLEEENLRSPPNIKLTLTQNQSSLVRDRLNLLIENGLLGLALVFATLWLFFGRHYSFWVAMGLPVSFGGALFVIGVLGLTLNLLSMVGLLIAVGVLMDDAIVISDNVAAHHARGATALDAAINGTREVMPSVLSSFATTACVFGPIMFLAGDLGAILGVIPIVLLITISVSLLEAFLILPSHLRHSIEARQHPSSLRQWGRAHVPNVIQNISQKMHQRDAVLREKFSTWFFTFRDKKVIPLVERLLEWRYLTVGSVVAILILSVGMIVGGAVKFQAFPNVDGDGINARLIMPQGTPLERTEEVIREIVAAADRINERETPKQPGGQSLIQHMLIEYGENILAGESGSHVAVLYIDLLSAEIRNSTANTFIRQWREELSDIPDVLSTTLNSFELGPAGVAIELELVGSDLDEMKAASLELQTWLLSYEGAGDIVDDLRPGKPEIDIRLRDGALTFGLDARAIASQLRSAFYGTTVDEIQVGSESFEIDVRLAPQDRNTIGDLEYFTVTTPNGAQVPLGAVATVEESRGFARLQRINGERAITITGSIDLETGNAAEMIADTTARFLPTLLEKYPGVKLRVKGQAEESAKTAASIQRGFLLGLLGVFLLLSLQFRSYIEPIIVMLTIPLSFIGVVWGHFIFGLNISMPSVVGFVSLGGIVVNNSILLVTFLKKKGQEGHTLHNSAVEAVRMRFRAITMTSLTTMMGLIPIMAETSVQALILKPLIASLAFGILSASLLVLFLVPSAFMICEDFGLTRFIRNESNVPPGATQKAAE